MSQLAPHGRGNVYAPDLLRGDNGLRMWFGGQGKDGHDRIQLAESKDGIHWQQKGVVLQDPSANHCNDPSVVAVHGLLFMFYTRAGSGVTDQIAVAVSTNGLSWEKKGIALDRGAAGSWDALSVGRPSALYDGELFRMWYDGRKDLPIGAPDKTAPKSDSSQRYVGYATSHDGFHWKRHGEQPVYNHDAGGIHVVARKGFFIMVSESHAGTQCAISRDGVKWEDKGLLMERMDIPVERHGHVTPFLLPDEDGSGATLFYGAASAPTWDANSICSRRVSPSQWEALNGKKTE